MSFIKKQEHLIISVFVLSVMLLFVLVSTAWGKDGKKESALVMITGPEAKKLTEDRERLSVKVTELKTISEEKREKHNKKRLDHYKNRLNKYKLPKGKMSILITGYSSTPDQTWGNPFITASGTRVHKGTMACPPEYPFGAKIKIEKKGIYTCEDRGGAIKGKHFDMWFASRGEALAWGKRIVLAEIVR